MEMLLPCADVLLLPSESESFGLAALEAMACGAPVVASNAGGIPEVVDDGVTGYLLPIGATSEMARAGVKLLSDDDLHASMTAAARRNAETRFSTEAVVPLYEQYYERVLDG